MLATMALSLGLMLALLLACRTRQGRAAQQRLARALAEREAERRLTDIAANLPGALYRLVRAPCGRLTCTYMSEGMNTLLGEPSGSSARASILRALTPETRARAEAALQHSATTLTPLVLEGDVRTADGRRLWLRTMASVHPLPDGSVVWDGVLLDSTEQRQAEERATLLAREVDHRAKNIMAVVRSLLLLTPRDVPPAQFVASLDGRLCAMARAHDLLAGGGWAGAELAAVARRELAIYDSAEAGPRLAWQGPPVKLAPGSVQPIEMILHELSTNAAKHGALSRSGGVVELRWAAAPQGGLTLDWRESGGPPIPGEPARHGFGFRLIHTLARHQLGGGATFLWSEEGLQCRIRLGAASVSAIEPLPEAPRDTPIEIPEPPARQAV
ncbi:HWE histidine kinase domain-containing protein [Pseudoroseomonas cervicalis]